MKRWFDDLAALLIGILVGAFLTHNAQCQTIPTKDRPAVVFLVAVFLDDKHVARWRIDQMPGPKACEIAKNAAQEILPRAEIRCMTAKNLKDI